MRVDVSRRAFLVSGASLLATGVAGCLGAEGGTRWEDDVQLDIANAHQYSALNCSCCEAYAPYLEEHLSTTLAVTVPEDIASVKKELGIPEDLRSCHTVVLDGYVVEGHVPAEVIGTLLDEAPAIDGIALPGMPTGSPGIGGTKREPFTFYVIGGGRTGEVYTER